MRRTPAADRGKSSRDEVGRDQADLIRGARPAPGRTMRILRRLALIVLVLGGAAGAVLVLAPSGWIVNRANVAVWIGVTTPLGLREAVSPEEFAAAMNVLLLVPLGAALAVLRPVRPWIWVLLTVVVSTAVELFQLLLGTREADPLDVLANTLGAAVGVGIGLVIVHWAHRRDARRCVSTVSEVSGSERELSARSDAAPQPGLVPPADPVATGAPPRADDGRHGPSAPATRAGAPDRSAPGPGGGRDGRD